MRKVAPSKAETLLLKPFIGLSINQIFIPKTEAEFAEATKEILATNYIGFDTESKPTFVAGEIGEGPHVFQFALPDKAYIFQIQYSENLPYLLQIIQSEDVLKIGFGLENDHKEIKRKLGTKISGVLDLVSTFKKDDYHDSIGVRGAIGAVLNQNFHKSKKISTSNWSLPVLNERQLLYAANDAYGALKVFEELKRTKPELFT